MGTPKHSQQELSDETMSLSASENDSDDDTSAFVVAMETTPLVTLFPLHGDATSAVAEPTATGRIRQSPSRSSDEEEEEEGGEENPESNSTSSFLHVFISSKGPPQIICMCILLAFGFGSTVGVVRSSSSSNFTFENTPCTCTQTIS
jgi:hypothetical protein